MLYKSSNIIICNNTPERSSGYSAPEGRACVSYILWFLYIRLYQFTALYQNIQPPFQFIISFVTTRRSKAPAIAHPKGARLLQLYLYFQLQISLLYHIYIICIIRPAWRREAPLALRVDHFSVINNKTSKNVSKSMIFSCKKHKNQNQQKSTAIFQKSIQMKTHFSSTKAKVYFLGVSKSNPFSQIPRSPDPQILRFYEKIGYIFVANP